MEDIHGFLSKSYDKAAEVPEPPLLEKILFNCGVAPMIVFKTLIILSLSFVHILRSIFYLIVPKPLKDIRGHVVVVTGGGHGIGREICLEFARSGCNVACLDVDLDAAKNVSIELQALGVKSKAYKVDVTNYNEIEDVKRQINADLGIVDILVNNAGLMPRASIRDGHPDVVRRVMDVNVLSHFWTTQIFIEDMIERRYGYIVAVSSMIAFYPTSQAAIYSTSKASVKGFMDAMHQETRHENWGVKMITVFPHMTNTRQELMDYLRMKCGPKTIERVGLRKPEEVGILTVHALRSGLRYVTVPSYYIAFGKMFEGLPTGIQDLFDDWVMPKITSYQNHEIKSANTNGKTILNNNNK